MEDEHFEDESPKDFKFPMSKQEKLNHDHLESNIKMLIDDDDEQTQKDSLKPSHKPIIVQQFSSTDGDEAQMSGIEKRLENLQFKTEERSVPDENSTSPSKTSLNRNKLNIMSNNYRPKNKMVKKGKLKKPQSQKEPNVNNLRDFGIARQHQTFYTGPHYVDHPTYYNSPGLIQDDNDNFQSPMNPYMQPGYNMYHGGYYHQNHPPPCLGRHPNNLIPRQASNPGYNDYIHSPNMIPPSLASSKSMLETVSSCGSVCSESITPSLSDAQNLLKSPIKSKKGFRKVKSTNEKSMPIDPGARTLMLS